MQLLEQSSESNKDDTLAVYLYINAIILQSLIPHINEDELRETYRVKAGNFLQQCFKLNEKLLRKLPKNLRRNTSITTGLLWDMWLLSANSTILRQELQHMLTSIKILNISEIKVTEPFYKELSLFLESGSNSVIDLNLSSMNTKFPVDEFVSVLLTFSNLQTINLQNADILGDHLAKFCKTGNWSKLKSINLSNCDNITNDVIAVILENTGVTLEELYVGKCPQLGDAIITSLLQYCIEIVKLDISGSNITDVGFKNLSKCSRLEWLDIGGMTTNTIEQL